MASNPPGKCCMVGVKHEGTAKGEIKKIGDFEAYFAYPENKSTQNAIIIVTDIFGHDFINAQLIADQFAANGYFVVMPDLFNKDPVPVDRPASFDLGAWLPKHSVPQVDPIVAATIKELRGPLGARRIGGVGYCFGGKYVVRFLKPGKFDVAYTAHPSFVDEAELAAVQGPLAISAAETDTIFPTEKRHQSEEILQKAGFPYQINLYSGVEHGYAVRGDISKKHIKYAKESSFLQAVQWFDEFLKVD